jgi:hypothetical protein
VNLEEKDGNNYYYDDDDNNKITFEAATTVVVVVVVVVYFVASPFTSPDVRTPGIDQKTFTFPLCASFCVQLL